MRLVEGMHHVTFLTEDVERLAASYGRVVVPDAQTLERAGWKTVDLR